MDKTTLETELLNAICSALSELNGDLSYDKRAKAKDILIKAKNKYNIATNPMWFSPVHKPTTWTVASSRKLSADDIKFLQNNKPICPGIQKTATKEEIADIQKQLAAVANDLNATIAIGHILTTFT